MTPEQFEQAKKELAEKWGFIWVHEDLEPNNDHILSDLNSLLEQHKEVITADMYPKEFVEWKDNNYHCVASIYWEKQPEDSNKTFRQIPHFSLKELYEQWLKNVKKS